MELYNFIKKITCTSLTDCIPYTNISSMKQQNITDDCSNTQKLIINRYGIKENVDVFLEACANGDIVSVYWLINNKIDIHHQNDKALYLACENNHKHIVKLLLMNGADISANGYHAFKMCIIFGYDKIIKVILNYVYEFNDVYDLFVQLSSGYERSNILRMLYAYRHKFLVNGKKMDDKYFINIHLYHGGNAMSDVFVSINKKND
ncbi:putative ankyrin repeat protein [Tupanvirus soda lake]|uniref:Ankyrin repeat protein n=2 Tax=Tupanvirus TaxID=2094720 RepID=A0AC62AB35_9VIRU|nr:putative ankyrin repeat protein [Tupanvirus soda lake]QKU34961.1 putative ankyrin repeat protein [Tupanvirus soda lake]